jgi:hypothetical protein
MLAWRGVVLLLLLLLLLLHAEVILTGQLGEASLLHSCHQVYG